MRRSIAGPKLALPGGARVAVWTIVNVENWQPDVAMPRTVLPPPMGQPLLPDLPNWAWHEYGMRVGIWRFFDVLAKRGLKATFALNGTVCELYPEICAAAHAAGWDFMGHGWVQKPMHRVEDQRAAIRATMDAIAKVTGKPPRGWESPGLTETRGDGGSAGRGGIEYVADWVLDDQPVPIRTSSGRLISVPYTVEINDVAITAVQQQPSRHAAAARPRPVRPAVSGGRGNPAGDGDLHPPLPHRRAAPDQVSRGAVRLHPGP